MITGMPGGQLELLRFLPGDGSFSDPLAVRSMATEGPMLDRIDPSNRSYVLCIRALSRMASTTRVRGRYRRTPAQPRQYLRLTSYTLKALFSTSAPSMRSSLLFSVSLALQVWCSPVPVTPQRTHCTPSNEHTCAVTARLDNATVVGVTDGVTDSYLGIPFAQPP